MVPCFRRAVWRSKASPFCGQNPHLPRHINYLVVVDEASGVDDVIHDVLKGALTHDRNRYIMTSQPTRPTGHFAEAMTKLARKSDGSGLYTAITMNSELSPIVSMSFIRDKLIEYGGHHSPEYQIRVLGNLPDNLSGYLIPRSWCVQCVSYKIVHAEPWGYVLCCDVAEGVHRDSSVMTLFKVSGHGSGRMVETVSCDEFLDMNEKQFARCIAAKYHELPAPTVAVDADGAGRTVILELEEMGIPVVSAFTGACHATQPRTNGAISTCAPMLTASCARPFLKSVSKVRTTRSLSSRRPGCPIKSTNAAATKCCPRTR